MHQVLNKLSMLTYDVFENECDETILERIRAGGRDFVWEKKIYHGYTALHLACATNASIVIVKMLIEVGGGQDFVRETDSCHMTSLHVACQNNASIDVVKGLIEVGGRRDFVLQKDRYGYTALHTACQYNASIDVVKELIEAGGGRDFVWEKDEHDRTALHVACIQRNTSIDVLKMLIEYGGGDIITQVSNRHKTPLQFLITESSPYGDDEEEKRAKIEKASFLINKGIELQIGGEYSFGGLFNNNTNEEEVQDEEIDDEEDWDESDEEDWDDIEEDQGIYKYWDDNVLPTLEQVMVQPRNRPLPILQALIVNKAPPRIIKSAVNTFAESISTRDSFGNKYPIDIAINHNLSWDEGMNEIIGTFATAQQTTPFNICTKHGVQWENGTKIILENDDNVDILEAADTSTGLFPFMVAAVGRCGNEPNYAYDFDSIFQLIKSRPLVVRQMKIGEEKQLSGKRKRSS